MNTNVFVLRSLISFGIVVSSLSGISIPLVSAQSSRVDQGIECMNKYRNFYYGSGGISNADAVAKAEITCAELMKPTRPNRPGGRYPRPNNNNSGGSSEAIVSCMKKLMYERKLVCTRGAISSCSYFPQEGFAGWQTQDVRTDISESTAVQACQNAR